MRTDKIWQSSHEYGSCIVNHNRKLMYIHIPKCASSYMKKYLELVHDKDFQDTWVGGNFTNTALQEYRPIIILRDPIKRWISACPGVSKRVGSEELDLNKNKEEILDGDIPILSPNSDPVQDLSAIKDMLWDEHVHPQSNFLPKYNQNPIWIQCDNRLSKNIHHLLRELKFDHGRNDHDIAWLKNPINTSTDHVNSWKRKYQFLWQEKLSKEPYISGFRKIYAKDYELIESVSFYDCTGNLP